MEEFTMKRRKLSTPAMFLLFAEGCFFLLLSAVVLACGFALNYNSNFDSDKVKSEIDYTQYWVGLTFFITSYVAIGVGARQRNNCLVLTALILFLICIFVSLFALVTEGNDWNRYKTAVRRKSFWDSEDDYSCKTIGSTCVCVNTKTNEPMKWISMDYDCELLKKLNYTYGAIVCSVLAGIFFGLSSIVIILIFIPMKHFTIPEPKKKIKRITVLQEKEKEPETKIVYRPTKVEQPEIEDIVVRERKPRRQRTIVYDEPIAQPRPQPQRTLIAIEPPKEFRPVERTVGSLERGDTQRMISHVYDEGRLVAEHEPRPSRALMPVSGERQFVMNPNFARSAPPAAKVYRTYEEGRPSPVIVRNERPVYRTAEPVYTERRLAPTNRKYMPTYREERYRVHSIEKRRVVDRPHDYIESRYPVQGRPRANSGEGPYIPAEQRSRVYPAERSPVLGREVVQYGRPRAYSDDERRGIYSGAKPRVFKVENTAPVVMQGRPMTEPEVYNTALENNLQSADKWEPRATTPY